MTKKTVYALRGLPASGKTTYAEDMIAQFPEMTVRINNDDLVTALYGASNTQRRETSAETLKALRESMLKTFLALPHIEDIYIDNTNLNIQTVRSLEKITKMLGHTFIVDDRFLAVDADECIRRDALRPNPVGEAVIRKMDKQRQKLGPWDYIKVPEITPYHNNFDLPSVVICDIDGTVAEGTGRSMYDYDKVDTDRLKAVVMTHVLNTAKNSRLVFMSGRPDSAREKTQAWLRTNLDRIGAYQDFDLYMRRTGDFRQDYIVKYELFQQHIADKYMVWAVFDDRNQVVQMWRKLGLQTYQVADGNF